MRTITIDAPRCELCKKTLIGEAVELTSGKRLHEHCLEDAAELGLKNALTLMSWGDRNSESNGNGHKSEPAWIEFPAPDEEYRDIVTGLLTVEPEDEELEPPPYSYDGEKTFAGKYLNDIAPLDGSEVTRSEPAKPPFVGQPMKPRADVKRIIEQAVASAKAEEVNPEPARIPTQMDRAQEWLREQLADGERWTAELFEAAEAAGFALATVRAASAAIGAENRRVDGNRFGKRLPGDTRLIVDAELKPEPEVRSKETLKRCGKCEQEKPATEEFFYSCPRAKDGFEGTCRECRKTGMEEARLKRLSEESIPDKLNLSDNEPTLSDKTTLPEPLTPESYIRRRDALGMTDTTVVHWVPTVSAGTLKDYAGGMGLPMGIVKSVEVLLAKLENGDEAMRNRYRYPEPDGESGGSAMMGGRAFGKLG